jgi:hypothetical protein
VKELKKLTESQINQMIAKAVDEGIKAGQVQAAKEKKKGFNAYRATEDRLYALPILVKKIEKDKERLKELEQYPHLPRRSKDICRFQKDGVRLSEEEIVEGLIIDITAGIAADEHEIETVQAALEIVKDDLYYQTLTRRYFDQINDKQIAKEMHCEETTVWRNRSRLVRRVAVALYGAAALS